MLVEVATANDTLAEQKFQSIVGTGHMRQWYKYRMAYSMMEDRLGSSMRAEDSNEEDCSRRKRNAVRFLQEQEHLQGWKYDLVPISTLKTLND